MRAWWASVVLLAGCSEAPPPAPRRPAAPRILQFYASPGLAAPGEAVAICYGVENASAVRLEPPVGEITPAFNRCVQVTVRQDLPLTLVAEGEGGVARQSLEVAVRAAAPEPRPTAAEPEAAGMITLLMAGAPRVRSGQPVLLCYGVRGAASVRLDPPVPMFGPSEKRCLQVSLRQTTTYTLTATAPDGRSERRQVTVQVD